MLKRIILMVFFFRLFFFLVFVLFPVHWIFICLSMVLNACLYPEPVSQCLLYSTAHIYICNMRVIVIIMQSVLYSYLTQFLGSYTQSTLKRIEYNTIYKCPKNGKQQSNKLISNKTHIHRCCTF